MRPRQKGRPTGQPEGQCRKGNLPVKNLEAGARLLAEQLKELEAQPRAKVPPLPTRRQWERKAGRQLRSVKAFKRMVNRLRRLGVAEQDLDAAVDREIMKKVERERPAIEKRKAMLVARNRRTTEQAKRGYATKESRDHAKRDGHGRFVKVTVNPKPVTEFCPDAEFILRAIEAETLGHPLSDEQARALRAFELTAANVVDAEPDALMLPPAQDPL